jgi:CPA2 family monovalent cation:H+ antiporter-2
MPHALIVTIAGGLTIALILGLVTQRLRLSPIVGYLLAGILVGPFTPGFVADSHAAEQLAEMGVILLMFGVGLHFHVDELLSVRKVAIPGALVQIIVATALGAWLGSHFGWGLTGGIVFGLAISVASTVVLLRVLSDNDALHTGPGHLAIGWLVIEDLFTVFVLVMMPVVLGGGQPSSPGAILVSAGLAIVKIIALVFLVWLFGRRAIPRLLAYVAKTRSRELFTLAVLAMALGIAVLSSAVFGVSMALGAFLAGMVVGQSEFSMRAGSEALPMRDAFAVLFFVSVGMLLDPMQIMPNLGIILATTAVVLVGKSIAAYAVVRLLRRPPKTALTVAIALAQIGEFSFILGKQAFLLGILPPGASQALVGASIISITLNPLLFRLVDPLSRWLERDTPTGPASSLELEESELTAIVVGHGPVGATVANLLKENGVRPIVLDLNHETVTELLKEGTQAIHGDASRYEILELAAVRRAHSVIFTAAGTPNEAAIQAAKTLNPNIRIIARTNFLNEVPSARAAGAHEVVAAEGEVALTMTEHVLRELGATPDQIDRARERVRDELEPPSA